jgi:D-sedoheptulose 7-phosphate isomerase
MSQNSDTDFDSLITYFERTKDLLKYIDVTELLQFCEIVKFTKLNKGKIMVIGNGGSGALASHFATDLGSGSIDRGNDFPVISLCDNSAIITAAANDFGYDNVFSRQIRNIGNSNDLLLAISSSGNSRNLISAIEIAKEMHITTASLTGFDGGKLKSKTDHNIHVPTLNGEYGHVEDLHSMVLHAISSLLRAKI